MSSSPPEKRDLNTCASVARLTSAGKIDTTWGHKGIYAESGIQALTATGRDAGTAFIDGRTAGITRIVPAKDGTVYVVGMTYDGIGSDGFQDGESYASVLHLTNTLQQDTAYSADYDGIAGFRADQVADGALTPQGDFVVLGGSKTGMGRVKFDGTSKATLLTYTAAVHHPVAIAGDALDISRSR